MDSNNENKNQELSNNNQTNEEEENSSSKKSEQLDLKKLITKIDNRVKTKVITSSKKSISIKK